MHIKCRSHILVAAQGTAYISHCLTRDKVVYKKLRSFKASRITTINMTLGQSGMVRASVPVPGPTQTVTQ